jgi:hypothetical protein
MLFSYYLGRGTVKDDTNFSCRFHIDTDRSCPIFRIGYILQDLQQQDPKTNLTALYYEVIDEFQSDKI